MNDQEFLKWLDSASQEEISQHIADELEKIEIEEEQENESTD